MPRYTMYVTDATAKVAPRHFDSPDDAKAKDFANKIALKSRGKWTRLTKRTAIPVDDEVDEVPVYGAFATAPVAGSNVQEQAKGIYYTTVPKNTVPFTIPAPKNTVVTESARVQKVTDPLSGGQISHLKTENGAAVTVMKQYTWIERVRKS